MVWLGGEKAKRPESVFSPRRSQRVPVGLEPATFGAKVWRSTRSTIGSVKYTRQAAVCLFKRFMLPLLILALLLLLLLLLELPYFFADTTCSHYPSMPTPFATPPPRRKSEKD